MKTCQCSGPGYCRTLAREVNETMFNLCQKPDVGSKWIEQKEAEDKEVADAAAQLANDVDNIQKLINFYKDEGADVQSITGMGDLIEKGLKQFGITPDRVKSVLNIEECHCEERKQWLNRIFPFV